MMTAAPILLVGAGGHATACIDVIEQNGSFVVAGLVGIAVEVGRKVLGYSVLGTDEELPALLANYPNALIAVGHIKTPEPRIRLFERLQNLGYRMPAVVSPCAYVSRRASLGPGSIVMPGAIVNAGAVVGSNCIINSQSLIEHDAVIADHCHIATAATINGGARVGAGTFIGSGCTVREQVVIGARSLIGMGQQVLADCEAETHLPGQRRP